MYVNLNVHVIVNVCLLTCMCKPAASLPLGCRMACLFSRMPWPWSAAHFPQALQPHTFSQPPLFPRLAATCHSPGHPLFPGSSGSFTPNPTAHHPQPHHACLSPFPRCCAHPASARWPSCCSAACWLPTAPRPAAPAQHKGQGRQRGGGRVCQAAWQAQHVSRSSKQGIASMRLHL